MTNLEGSDFPQTRSAPQEWLDLSLLHVELTKQPQIHSSTKLWSGKPEPGSHNYSRFIHKTPLEIRNMIYELLLVNPILGDIAAIREEFNYGALTKYGLHPAILTANHQIYEEASSILYESNNFILDTVTIADNYNGATSLVQPMTRFTNESKIPQTEIGDWLRGMRKVRHWKVIVCAEGAGPYHQNPSVHGLGTFCRQISRSSLRSLEILVLPRYMNHASDYENFSSDIDLVLQSLSILRNINDIRFQNAEKDIQNVYSYIHRSSSDIGELLPALEDPEFGQIDPDLVSLVIGNSPIELVGEMYDKLLDYVELFERHGSFQLEMRHVNASRRAQRWGTEYTEFKDSHGFNPYTVSHPVEQAIIKAHQARNDRRNAIFKAQRNIAVQYLEPQFQRLLAASTNILEFIKSEKRAGHFFDCQTKSSYHYAREGAKFQEALVLIEDYASAFERDMSLEVRKLIRGKSHHFENLYSMTCEKPKLRDLDRYFQMKAWDRFILTFKEAFDALDGRFLAILAARRALFESDITDRCCDIKPGTGGNEGLTDWGANEPEITVPTGSDPPSVTPAGW